MTKQIVGKVNAVDWITENGGYPEVGQFADQKSLQKFYKQLETEVIEDWCSIEGLEFKACPEQAPIHRMRACMAILYKHFPKETKGSSKKSKYADYKTEDLIQMALDNSVPVEPTESMPIMRMRVIMALRAHGVLAE
jgi:hypothetical protein